METLDILLMEQDNIKSKINGALKKLKEWFENKIDEAHEIFESIKEKVLKKLGKIEDPTIKSKAKTELNKVKTSCSDAIKNCKSGISCVSKGDAEGANDKKKKVIKALAVTAGIITGIGAIIGGTKAYKKHKNGKTEVENMGVDSSHNGKIIDVETRLSTSVRRPKPRKKELASGRALLGEEFDFEALMEEIDSIGEEYETSLEEEFDFEALMEEIDSIGEEYETSLEEEFDFDLDEDFLV